MFNNREHLKITGKCRQASDVGSIGLGGFVIPSRPGRDGTCFSPFACYPYVIPNGIKNVVLVYNQLYYRHCKCETACAMLQTRDSGVLFIFHIPFLLPDS
jgi:hypothetical protein